MMDSICFGYAVCPVDQRVALLTELVSRYWDAKEKSWSKKVIILFHHDNCTKFFVELFSRLKGLPVMPLLKPQLTAKGGLDDYTFFCDAETGMLATTPQTAQCLPDLRANIIIQYDPPSSVEIVTQLATYCSTYLMFLRPTEVGFIGHLKDEAGLKFEERFIPWDHVPKLPTIELQNWYKTFHSMNLNSKAAYKAYLDSIRDHQLQEFFNMKDILLKEVAEGFCFAIPPYYKLVKETPRYELQLKAKELKKTQPLPFNAPVIKTSFKRIIRDHDSDLKARKELKRKAKKKTVIASDKNKNWVLSEGVVYNPDGTVRLSRDSEMKYSLTKNKIRVSKDKMKALKKQLDNVPGMKKKKQLLKKMKRNRR
ncbi:ATP-dependent RNA helicase has1 [Hyalella azteca]|uniref:ATP-dependent RNA helicase has1 n=1 Tax=Hyalella azteca TaxID=294128 RepID=A0A8B7N0D0_HYAAZ|nr:ATP-dependent RNA helicase has1 [Hyalella azteca]